MKRITNYKVAVVQAGSEVMNKDLGIQKAIDYIESASENNAKIIVFPEAFIPAYPRGMSFGTVVGNRSQQGREDFQAYLEHSIHVPGPETEILGRAAKKAAAYVVIGVIEQDQESSKGSLYCTALFFGPDGSLLGKHRKLKPTGSERLIWGEGDGSTLPVFDTPYGKIGALICWENYMPLARMAMYEKGIQIFVMPTADARDSWLSTVRHVAAEGRCFVLSCNQYTTKDMFPENIVEREVFADWPNELTRGGSCIAGPLGEFIEEPVFGEEKIIYADLDMNRITEAQYDFDVTGHYSRPDVFQLHVNEKKQKNVTWEEDIDIEEKDTE